MITMTIREALEIQAGQVTHYAKYSVGLAHRVAAITNVPEGADLDASMTLMEINRIVPRGFKIACLAGCE